MKKEQLIKWLRYFVITIWATAIAIGLLFIVSYVLKHGRAEAMNDLREILEYYPGYTILIFLVMFTLRGFIFIPVVVFYTLAGILFPLWTALAVSFVGMLTSASLIFITAQFLGKKALENQNIGWLKKVNQMIHERGFFAAMLSIIIPFISLDMVAVFAGMSRMTFTDFFLAVILTSPAAMAPYVIAPKGAENPVYLIITAIMIAIVIALAIWAYYHPHFDKVFGRRRKKKKLSLN